MSRETKRLKREDEAWTRPFRRTKSAEEQRLELLAEAIRFLSLETGKGTTNFTTFSDVRRKLKIDGRTREELRMQCLVQMPGNCLG